jgi:hypothetical protein
MLGKGWVDILQVVLPFCGWYLWVSTDERGNLAIENQRQHVTAKIIA